DAWAAACPTVPGLPKPTAQNSVTFGDGISYSLPILNIDVQSSPGQIQDCLVLFTGAGGPGSPVVVNQNPTTTVANAYRNVQGSQNPYFRTGDTTLPNQVDPGGAGQFVGDTGHTWDITLQTLSDFLAGGQLTVLFNHNQTGASNGFDPSGGTGAVTQNLAIW